MIVKCNNCQKEKKVPPSRIDGRTHFCSRSCYYEAKIGQPSKKDTRVTLNCVECRTSFKVQQYRIAQGARFCSRSCAYKNADQGLTDANERDRKSAAYKLWRKAVFERDNHTCVFCNKRGGELQADHIKPFALFPTLRFLITNGRTLCVDCHKSTDTYGRSNVFRVLAVNRQA